MLWPREDDCVEASAAQTVRAASAERPGERPLSMIRETTKKIVDNDEEDRWRMADSQSYPHCTVRAKLPATHLRDTNTAGEKESHSHP